MLRFLETRSGNIPELKTLGKQYIHKAVTNNKRILFSLRTNDLLELQNFRTKQIKTRQY